MKTHKRKPVVQWAVVADCGHVEFVSDFKREAAQHIAVYSAECSHETCGPRSIVKLVEVRR